MFHKLTQNYRKKIDVRDVSGEERERDLMHTPRENVFFFDFFITILYLPLLSDSTNFT